MYTELILKNIYMELVMNQEFFLRLFVITQIKRKIILSNGIYLLHEHQFSFQWKHFFKF
jgi:hypothetical protein